MSALYEGPPAEAARQHFTDAWQSMNASPPDDATAKKELQRGLYTLARACMDLGDFGNPSELQFLASILDVDLDRLWETARRLADRKRAQ